MDLSIAKIGFYLPDEKILNPSRIEKFSISEAFLSQKIGMNAIRIKNSNEETSDLCVSAFLDLQNKAQFKKEEIECLILCTQNPDNLGLPHTSAIVHDKLGLDQNCAVFDISLGCSGYVYGISILKGFMETNLFKKGVLITADPYSKIIDENDRNTSLLFGDAATATLMTLSSANSWHMGKFVFGSDGSHHLSLKVNPQTGKLEMNGRQIFNFAAKTIPSHIEKTLLKNKLNLNEIDRFLIHQGSKYLVEMIRKKLGVTEDKLPFMATDYGNTVSSSIPMMLKDISNTDKYLLICGFGVGLSWGSCVLTNNASI